MRRPAQTTLVEHLAVADRRVTELRDQLARLRKLVQDGESARHLRDSMVRKIEARDAVIANLVALLSRVLPTLPPYAEVVQEIRDALCMPRKEMEP